MGVGPAGREDETCAIKGEGRTGELGGLIENEGGWRLHEVLTITEDIEKKYRNQVYMLLKSGIYIL